MLTYFHPEVVKKFLRVNNLENYAVSIDFLKVFGRAFQKMPYENLTKLIRAHTIAEPYARLRLPEVLYDEYLSFGTGGTCFSMTYFMQTILRFCGFDTYPVIADRPLAPAQHCLSIIRLGNERYILGPGFMIETPLLLTKIPTKYILNHNDIVIGAGATPCHCEHSEAIQLQLHPPDRHAPIFIGARDDIQLGFFIATESQGKTTIRYIFRDAELSADEFLSYWLASFDWPTLRNISITIASEAGYIYARNNFIRRTTKIERKQERIKSQIEPVFGKLFGINEEIIREGFEILHNMKTSRSF